VQFTSISVDICLCEDDVALQNSTANA